MIVCSTWLTHNQQPFLNVHVRKTYPLTERLIRVYHNVQIEYKLKATNNRKDKKLAKIIPCLFIYYWLKQTKQHILENQTNKRNKKRTKGSIFYFHKLIRCRQTSSLFFIFQVVLKVRKRVTLMVVTVSIIFSICWLTDASLYLLTYYSATNTPSDVTYSIGFIMVLFNSAVNPFVYALLNQRFRQKLKRMICCSFRSANQIHPSSYVSNIQLGDSCTQSPQLTKRTHTSSEGWLIMSASFAEEFVVHFHLGNVIKQLFHAFSCAPWKFWIAQVARVAVSYHPGQLLRFSRWC